MDTWVAQSKCLHDPHVDTDFFFPEWNPTVGGLWPTPRMIARYCADCPVRRQCEQYAAKHKLYYGYFGGKGAESCKP